MQWRGVARLRVHIRGLIKAFDRPRSFGRAATKLPCYKRTPSFALPASHRLIATFRMHGTGGVGYRYRIAKPGGFKLH